MSRPVKKQQPPEPRPDINEWAQSLPTNYLQCRDFGHSWRPFTARWVAEERAYESQLRCGRCKTVRYRWISRTGEQLGAHYDYAPGYLASKPKGIGRLVREDRNWLRLESVLRVLPDDAAEED